MLGFRQPHIETVHIVCGNSLTRMRGCCVSPDTFKPGMQTLHTHPGLEQAGTVAVIVGKVKLSLCLTN
jgi:hypothetical protein